MSAKSRKWYLLALVALIAYLLYRSRHSLNFSSFNPHKLWHALENVNYFYLLLAVLTIYLCYAIRALRWQKFQSHVGPAHFWNIYAMNLAGFTALFLLGRVGEPVRPLLISRKDKIPRADTFGIYALERILDAACTAALVAIAGLVYLRLHGSAFLERRLAGWNSVSHGWRPRVAQILLGFSRGVQTIKTAGDLFAAVFLSAIHWVLVVVVYYLIVKAFGGTLGLLSFADAMLVLVFTMVGSAVQLPGVGGGAQALSIIAFTRLYGVEQEPAV